MKKNIQHPIHLIVQYYRCAAPERQAEIDTCLRNNLQNSHLVSVHLLTEELFDLSAFPNSTKIIQTVVGERLTYERAFRYANDVDPKGDNVWVLSNADIYFDDTLINLTNFNQIGLVYALSRHEVLLDGSVQIMETFLAHGSQDAWIFRTPIDLTRMNAAVAMGIPGCDQRIAHEFVSAGNVVLNPSLTIVARHLDCTRDYDMHERVQRYMDVTNEEGYRAGLAAPPPHQLFLYPTDKLNLTAFDLFVLNLDTYRESQRQEVRVKSLQDIVAELERQVAELQKQIEESARQITGRDGQLAEKSELLAVKSELLAEREHQLTSILNSLSWRMTKPLRKMFDFFACNASK